MKTQSSIRWIAGLFALTVLAALPLGCSRLYYDAMEKIGVPKRDIMVKRVTSARDSQTAAKEEFASALDRFRSVLSYKGGTLEEKYDKLNSELQKSESRAREVHDRIASVEDVSTALFREWEGELDQYSDPKLRARSEQKLNQTRQRYDQLITAMHRAEDRIEPVLKPLRDQVLVLKHDLNAQAIASLQGELGSIEGNVDQLVRDMQTAIDEANQFISTMQE